MKTTTPSLIHCSFAALKRTLAGLVVLAITASLTAACSNDNRNPAAASTVATGELSRPVNNFFSACTIKGNTEDSKASMGSFVVSTNVWNPNAVASFNECIKAKVDNTSGAVDAQFTWDVTGSNNEVLSYPNFGYGWQVGTEQGSTTKRLPARVSELPDIQATGRIETVCSAGSSCTMNTAFEMLFSSTATPTVWPPIAEVMVWVQATCGHCNAGKLQGKVTVDGVDFDVYKGVVTPPTGTASWTYVAYVAQKTVTQLNFNMKHFVTDSLTRGYLQPTDYLSVVELGTEVTSGKGTTTITGYNVR
jgi:hypothetical protein